jgi:hypothetical protein
MKDTILNEKSSQKMAEMSELYKSEKKEEQIKLLEKDKERISAVTEAENWKKNVIISSIVGVLLAVMLVSGFILRSLRITRKQNIIIEMQKSEVEQSKLLVEMKQKEVLDSINYAGRIQRSLLPTESYIEKTFARLKQKNKLNNG